MAVALTSFDGVGLVAAFVVVAPVTSEDDVDVTGRYVELNWKTLSLLRVMLV